MGLRRRWHLRLVESDQRKHDTHVHGGRNLQRDLPGDGQLREYGDRGCNDHDDTYGSTGIADGEIYFGDPGDRFVAGDWGVVDGRDTPAVYRPSDRTVYFRHTLTEGIAVSKLLWPGAGASWWPVAGGFNLASELPSSGSVAD